MTDILEGGFTPPGPELIRERAERPSERRPGKVRPFWQGFGLAVVTLTLYHFWWHWNTHQEVAARRGEPDRWSWLWPVYIVTLLLSAVVSFVQSKRAAWAGASGVGLVGQWNAWAAAGIDPHPHQAAVLAASLFFLVFVGRQYWLLRGLRREHGLSTRNLIPIAMGLLPFVFMDLLRLLPPHPFGILVFLGVAMWGYALLQSEYNETWRSLAKEEARLLPAEVLEVGRTSDGRVVLETVTKCPACGASIALVGVVGERVPSECSACGRRGEAILDAPT